jgi:hypothetical protein
MAWWTALRLVSVINVVTWTVVAASVWAARPGGDPVGRTYQRTQLALAALFVLGCGFRSFLPWSEAHRFTVSQSNLSSAAIARAVATIAELALVTQWALIMREMARTRRVPLAFAAACLIVPLIVMAEVCSWYSALTTNFIGSVVEESLWAVTSALATAGLWTLLPFYQGNRRRIIAVAIALNVAYIGFMTTVDVPMYMTRWGADQTAGRVYLTVAEGWQDAATRRVVTRRWDDWREEIPWMSLYFSAGVWISLGLAYAARSSHARQRTTGAIEVAQPSARPSIETPI